MNGWDLLKEALIVKSDIHKDEIIAELSLNHSEKKTMWRTKHSHDECHGCDLYTDDGHCRKYRKNGKCVPSTKDWLNPGPYDEPLKFIPINRMCRHSSIFGTDYIGLTDEDIERLKNGEVAYLSGECEIFIGYVEKEKGNEENH